ncbi:MAG: hypothetical protein ACFCU6_06595 [Balneolaceae bacterium]
MKTCKFYTLSFFLLLISGVAYPCFGQEAGFPPIERDESFEPYVRFEEETGRYFIGHLRDADTGEIYEAVYEPPTLISPLLNVNLNYEGLFRYSYVLFNMSDSKQNISSFKIQIKDQFENIELPEPWFFREFRTEPFIRIVHKVFNVPEYEEGEPIIFESDLLVNESFQFKVESKYPPAIVDVYASGSPTILNFHFVLPPTLRGRELRDSLRTQVEGADHRGVLVKTLGPKSPPDPFDHLDFLDSLRGYIPQAGELEWIAGESFTGELSGLLDDARTRLAAGDSSGAAAPLASFISLLEQVEQGEGPPGAALTSEGYALLFFNGQYLLDRLPPTDPPGSGITCECLNPVSQNSGTITVSGGDTRCLDAPFSGSAFFESGGTLEVCNTATLQNIGGNQPGRIGIAESGQVSIGNWTNNFSDDAIINWGSLNLTSWVTVNNGSLTNHGDLVISGGLNQNNGPVTNYGRMDVAGTVTFNQPGNVNEGRFITGSGITLNSNATLSNTCRVEAEGPLVVNGSLSAQGGALLRTDGQMTVNSGGSVSLEGSNAMISAGSLMLNGAITAGGTNHLLRVPGPFTLNSGAAITASGEPLGVCTPGFGSLPAGLDITAGCSFVIPSTECNPQGFNSNE